MIKAFINKLIPVQNLIDILFNMGRWLTVLVFIQLFFFLTPNLFAKVSPAARPVTISSRSIAMADLLRIISEQTQMRAFFAQDVLDLNEIIQVDFDHTPLESVLRSVIGKKGLAWKYYKETFVIAEKDSGKATPHKYPGDRSITLHKKNITIASLFRHIGEQADIHDFFDETLLNTDEQIAVNFDRTPLDDVLTSVIGKKGFAWKYDGKIFTITKKDSRKPPPGKRIIRANFKNIRFRDLWESIWQQARVQAWYNDENLNSNERITANVGIITFDGLLTILLGSRNLTWQYRGDGAGRDALLIFPKTNKAPLPVDSVENITKKQSKSNKGQLSKPTPAVDLKAIRSFWIKPPNLKEVIAFEKKIKSYIDDSLAIAPLVSIKGGDYPLIGKYRISTKPFAAERQHPAGELPTYIRYFYTKKDSVVRMAVYDWMRIYESEFSNEQKEKLQAESHRISAVEHGKLAYYQKEFNRVRKILIEHFGNPTRETDGDGAVWDTESYYGSLKLSFSPDDHRVRFKLYWK